MESDRQRLGCRGEWTVFRIGRTSENDLTTNGEQTTDEILAADWGSCPLHL